jgi:hypothetical protein
VKQGIFQFHTEPNGRTQALCAIGSAALLDARELSPLGEFDEAEPDADEDEEDEGPFESLLRHAAEIEADLMPGWKLDRSQPGALLWTTPSGRQYRSMLDGSSYEPYQH